MPSLDEALASPSTEGWRNKPTQILAMWLRQDPRQNAAWATIADGLLGTDAGMGALTTLLKSVHIGLEGPKAPALREMLNWTLLQVDWTQIAQELWEDAQQRRADLPSAAILTSTSTKETP